jgi:hypothetical protein
MNYDKVIDKLFFIDNIYNKNNAVKYNTRKKKRYQNIQNYILNRYNDSKSERETIYRIHYNIEKTPLCPMCGNPLSFRGRKNQLFLSHCSNKCKKLDKNVNEKWKDSCGEKGTNRDKAKKTMMKRYGVENPYQIPEVIEKIKIINKEKLEESLRKQKETCLNKYGVESYLQTDKFKEQSKETCIKKYGVDHPMKSKEVQSKYNREELVKKIIATKELHGTFNTSNDEDESYEILKAIYPDTIRQYKSDRYPFLCDFYIPSLDLFIECQYGWQHGNHPFNKDNNDDIERLKKMKERHTKYYDAVIYNWSIRDVNKRNTAKLAGINYIEFWNIDELKKWINLPLYIHYDYDKIINEYNYYKNKEGNLNGSTSYNFIIKYYQQDVFFKAENELIYHPETEKRLIENRCKYLNKQENELTTSDLLLGFKRSGIYYGYSHFNPLIFKYFIEKYNIKKCYDPTGGWGHRLLGSNKLEQYIYNDLSKTIYNNVKRITKELKINNAIFYNNDANLFMPEQNFDSMFTCPPYFNIEEYECKNFENIEEYNQFIDNLFNVFYNKKSCKIFGLVIREDLLSNKYKEQCKESFEINNKKPKHLTLGTKHYNKEYLYVFMK